MADVQRLDKILANAGYGTRKEIRKFVHSQEVLVNNVRCKDVSFHVKNTDNVLINGILLEEKKELYLMLHKPQRVISATKDFTHQTIIDILPTELIKGFKDGEIFPIGRLDIDTEGLIIITSDGKICHKLTSPKNNIEKTYFVTLEKPVDESDQLKITCEFEKGIHLSAERGEPSHTCKPAFVQFSSPTQATLTITEGKYHQVKRMFFAVKNYVVALKRISFASLALDEQLPCGQCRILNDEEIALLKKAGECKPDTI
ncbi:MAG: pseudouridine synthase [Treponemataceae bacterium]